MANGCVSPLTQVLSRNSSIGTDVPNNATGECSEVLGIRMSAELGHEVVDEQFRTGGVSLQSLL